MKNLFRLMIASVLIASCSEDFKIAAPYKEVTVVYGLLSVNDTAHYIRIQKAFMDENQSAVNMAQVSDSSFYNQLDVKIKEISGGSVVGIPVQLTKVDLAAEGYPKDPGSFFTDTSWAYKFKKTLNPNNMYRLVVTHLNDGRVDSSEINVLDSNVNSSLFISTTFKLKFSQTFPEAASVLKIIGNPPTNAKYMEGIIRFKWVNKNLQDNTQEDKHADFSFATWVNKGGGTQFELSSPNIAFYSFLRDAIGTAPGYIQRYLDSCDFYFYAGGNDMYDYALTSLAQANGLTADQVKPLFTNIRGKDVIGLFSSRSLRVKLNVPIDSITLDSLQENKITNMLNIKGFSDH